MEYRKFNDKIIVRIDKGEEIVEQVMKVAAFENLKLASITAIGAVNEFDIGSYDVIKKEYKSNHFVGTYEIVSLLGTITQKEGKPYLHLHLACGNEKGEVFGGHLTRAIISATCEMVINVIEGKVNRKFDEIGLNLFDFED